MSKKNIILAGLLFLVVGFLFFQNQKEEKFINDSIKKENIKLFEKLDTKSIKNIKIIKSNQTTTLQKEGSVWVVKEKNNFMADQSFVEQMIAKLKELRIGNRVSEHNDKSDKKFGFDKGVEIKVAGKNFKIGKSFRGKMFILSDGNVYLSPSDEKRSFLKYDNEYRERSLFNKISPSDILEVAITDSKKNIKISRDNSGKLKLEGGKNLDSTKAESFISSIASLDIANFLDSNFDIENNNEKNLPLTISLVLKNGKTSTLIVTGQKIKSENKYIIKKDGLQFAISKYNYTKLLSFE